MAEAFLFELLQMHNSVHNPEERCGICLEEYGTLSRETGTMEVEIRLPCNHTIGSACIAIWLKANNTCPVCRHEFFPAQPRPYLEHGVIMNGLDDAEQPYEGHQQTVSEINADYCNELSLDIGISMISGLISQKLTESENWSQGHTSWCIVSVSIYMASHLTGEPRSPREIATVTGVEADHIRFCYDLIYPERDHLANAHLLSLLQDTFDAVAPLNWPAPGYEFTDEQIENNHISHMLRQGYQRGCNELGLDADVVEISAQIAENLGAAGLMSALGPEGITAAAIFMAAHMVGCPVAAGRVAEVVGTSDVAVRAAYGVAHAHRYRLLEHAWLEEIGQGSVERVWGRLPPP